MLCWFVKRDVAEAALHGDCRLKATDICRSFKTAACLDSNVCMQAIQKYCDSQAWETVQLIVSELNEEAVWHCAGCTLSVNDEKCIACDSCLQWFHFRCAALKTAPKAKVWFCKECKM